jgi:hypothetical protein
MLWQLSMSHSNTSTPIFADYLYQEAREHDDQAPPLQPNRLAQDNQVAFQPPLATQQLQFTPFRTSVLFPTLGDS